jgi:hypothetical protein
MGQLTLEAIVSTTVELRLEVFRAETLAALIA